MHVLRQAQVAADDGAAQPYQHGRGPATARYQNPLRALLVVSRASPASMPLGRPNPGLQLRPRLHPGCRVGHPRRTGHARTGHARTGHPWPDPEPGPLPSRVRVSACASAISSSTAVPQVLIGGVRSGQRGGDDGRAAPVRGQTRRWFRPCARRHRRPPPYPKLKLSGIEVQQRNALRMGRQRNLHGQVHPSWAAAPAPVPALSTRLVVSTKATSASLSRPSIASKHLEEQWLRAHGQSCGPRRSGPSLLGRRRAGCRARAILCRLGDEGQRPTGKEDRRRALALAEQVAHRMRFYRSQVARRAGCPA